MRISSEVILAVAPAIYDNSSFALRGGAMRLLPAISTFVLHLLRPEAEFTECADTTQQG